MQSSRCCKWSDIKDMRVEIDEETPIESMDRWYRILGHS